MLQISNHGKLVIFEHVFSSHRLVLKHQCIMISEEAHFSNLLHRVPYVSQNFSKHTIRVGVTPDRNQTCNTLFIFMSTE